jgi:ABC-type transport system substrate-binding protein
MLRNFQVRLRPVAPSVYAESATRRGGVGISLGLWIQDFPDPADFIEAMFHSRNIHPEGSLNITFYANPRLDALLDRARAEPDRGARLEMYRAAERTLVDDAPWAFLFYPLRIAANQPYVRGYVPNPNFSYDFRDVWLDLPRRRAVDPTREGSLARVLAGLGWR